MFQTAMTEKPADQAALETAQGGDVASIITALTRQGEPLVEFFFILQKC